MATKQNKLKYSEEFDNALYTKFLSAISANAVTNPIDSALTADRLADTGVANNYHGCYPGAPLTLPPGQYTLSVYAKAGEWTWLALAINVVGTEDLSYFDLANGVVGTTHASQTPKITPVVGYPGWYRCSITRTTPYSTAFYSEIFTASGNGGAIHVGDATKGLYLFGFQLVQANWEGPYCPTTVQPVDDGNIRNIDAEAQNFFTYSDDQTNANWVKTNVGSTTGGQIDPFGGTTACLFTDTVDGAPTSHYYRQTSAGLLVAKPFSILIYAKPGTKYMFSLWDASTGTATEFNLQTLVVTHTPAVSGRTGRIIPAPNGFYRCEATWPSNVASGTSWILQIYGAGTGTYTYQGDGTGTMTFARVQISQSNVVHTAPTLATVLNTGRPRDLTPSTQTGSLINWDFRGGVLPNDAVFLRAAGTAASETVQTGTSTVVTTGITTNIPRFGKRLDADVIGLVLEPTRINVVLRSTDISNASWLNSFGLTFRNTQAPDGGTAKEMIALSPTVWQYLSQNPLGAAGIYTQSVWYKWAYSGVGFIQTVNPPTTTNFTTSTLWKVVEQTATHTAATYYVISPTEGTLESISNVGAWGAQYEVGAYRSEHVITAGASATRQPERLYHPNAAASITGKLKVRIVFRPKSTLANADSAQTIWYINGTNYCEIATTGVMTVVVGGTSNTTAAIVWAQYDTVDLMVDTGNKVAVVTYSVNGGATVTPAVAGAAQPVVPAGTTLDIGCNGATNQLACWLLSVTAEG